MPEINKNNDRFANIFYKSIIIILVILAFLSFVSSGYLDEDFFLKKSQDKELHSDTIQKIYIFQKILLIAETFFVFLILIFLHFNKKICNCIDKNKLLFQNLLLLIGTILVFIFIGEIIARITLSNDSVGGDFGPGSIKFNLNIPRNQDGMRDRDFTIIKPENTIRIAAIGDSFTYGWGIENSNNVYPKVLEKKLNNISNINYEVLNFGLPDSNTEDELLIIKEKALKYNPDIIILGYYINDLENIDSNNIEENFYIEMPYIGFILRNSFYLYYFFETRSNYLIERFILKDPYSKIIQKRFESEINKNHSETIFKELKAISKKNKMPVLIVSFPAIYKLDDYYLLNANEFINEIADENDFYFVDMFDIYKNYDENELIVSIYDRHPSEFGHELAADAILNELKEKKLSD